MKKKLEAELISIAHRILKLKNKSDIVQLHEEAQKLYEKLAVLRFVEENLSEVKPTIGLSQLEDKIEKIFESENNFIKDENSNGEVENEVIAATVTADLDTNNSIAVESIDEADAKENFDNNEVENEQSIVDDIVAEINPMIPETPKDSDIVEEEMIEVQSTFKPDFELSFEAAEEEDDDKEQPKSEVTQITFDDLLGKDYVDPVFVKPEELAKEKEVIEPKSVIPIARSYNETTPVISINNEIKTGSSSVNDKMAKGIIIGLNDRIAFMNHLFANSSEDYNRVLSQLMTFDTFGEAKDFIDNMVKPDYNNWEGKEEYEDRFMQIVEKKFS